MNILDYVALLRTRLLALFSNGAEVGDRHSASSLAGRLIELLRFQAQLSGQLAEYGRAGVNIVSQSFLFSSNFRSRRQRSLNEKPSHKPSGAWTAHWKASYSC
jgi:hypothetical protein